MRLLRLLRTFLDSFSRYNIMKRKSLNKQQELNYNYNFGLHFVKQMIKINIYIYKGVNLIYNLIRFFLAGMPQLKISSLRLEIFNLVVP